MTSAPVHPDARSFIGLGSNLGDRSGQLAEAVWRLGRADRVSVLRLSSLYETAPVESPLDQPDFYNAVAEVQFKGDPLDLLRSCQDIERAMGRVRPVPKGPRCIDLDVLLAGETLTSSVELTLPHPGLTERAFVLVPLLELDGELLDPRDGSPLREHLARVQRTQRVRRVASAAEGLP